MIHSKLVRLLAIGAIAGSASVAVLTGPASAAGTGIKCGALTGNIANTVKLSKCSGNTGKSSKAIPATQLATGGKITWVNGKTTTLTLTAKAKGTACPAGSTEYQAKGMVTGDTTGSATVGSAAKASACIDGAGNVTLVPGTKAVI
jgi:hypothetical protein